MPGNHSKTPSGQPADKSPEALGINEAADLLGITVSSLRARRARDPASLPPPYLNRPLRWRRSTVLSWMTHTEQAEADRAAELTRRLTRRRS
jgi:hypothetical protein